MHDGEQLYTQWLDKARLSVISTVQVSNLPLLVVLADCPDHRLMREMQTVIMILTLRRGTGTVGASINIELIQPLAVNACCYQTLRGPCAYRPRSDDLVLLDVAEIAPEGYT